MSLRHTLFTVVAVMLPSSMVVGSPAAVTKWELHTAVYAGFQPTDWIAHKSPTLPFSHDDTATDGASACTTTYDFTTGPHQVLFGFEFDHAHGPAWGAGVDSFGFVTFTAAEDSTYSFSGNYAIQGREYSGIITQLKDLTAGKYVFRDSQDGTGTVDPVLTVGEAGLFQDMSVGEPVGTLIAGHNYRMYYDYAITYYSFAGGLGQTATGTLQFTIRQPEPSAILLLTAGALAFSRRRR